MNQALEQVKQSLQSLQDKSGLETHTLYPGIELSLLTLNQDSTDLHHDSLEHIIEINYCRRGRIGWKLNNGNTIYLGPGDYSLHTMACCSHSSVTLPNGSYEGLVLTLDIEALTHTPPDLLSQAQISGEMMYEKFCKNGSFSSFPGNETTDAIFSGFYGQPENLQASYWKLKSLELLLYLSALEPASKDSLTEYHSEQIEIIRSIHQQLISNLDKRFTIESLSRQYLMNPTTLKTVFKAVYGCSIAAHIKAHRMEHAARLLLETEESIGQIGKAVGYDNQSKFTAAFKEYYQMLPTEYRKLH